MPHSPANAMTSELKILFLGTGTSTGVPLIGCQCEVCQSSSPKNKRLRSSVIIDDGSTRLLVDSSPDLRQQALREGISSVDAVVYTHCHLDHVAGFDDLRAFCWKRTDRLPIYGSPETLSVLERMYPWAFDPANTYQGYVRPRGICINRPRLIGNIEVTPVPVLHAGVETNGYVFRKGNVRIGYACDAVAVPDSSIPLFQGLDLLVLDCLRYDDHPTHMNLEHTLKVFEQTQPRQGLLTHMSHSFDFDELAQKLPPHISPAYDGLSLRFPL